jgi:hypothetical protein
MPNKNKSVRTNFVPSIKLEQCCTQTKIIGILSTRAKFAKEEHKECVPSETRIVLEPQRLLPVAKRSSSPASKKIYHAKAEHQSQPVECLDTHVHRPLVLPMWSNRPLTNTQNDSKNLMQINLQLFRSARAANWWNASGTTICSA